VAQRRRQRRRVKENGARPEGGATKTIKMATHLSMITGSEGVSLRLPQLFLSQHRLKHEKPKFRNPQFLLNPVLGSPITVLGTQ